MRLTFTPTARNFLRSVLTGQAREHALCGTRGEGKSWTALDAMIEHAIEHGSRVVKSRDGTREGRYRLPVPWISVTDTFESHKRKLAKSMQRPEWEGVWRLSDNLHVATAVLGEAPLVRVELFGIEDQGAKSRVRLETCGVHFEEVAPASEELEANGVDEDSWEVALSSQRVVTYCVCDTCKDPAPVVAEDLDEEGFVLGDSRPVCLHCGQEARRVYPAFITSNYPDEDHWFWKRFKVDPRPGTALFEIQPGERVSKQERETRAAGISNPVLRDRLYGGKPGSLRRGDPVTGNYQEGRHYTRQVLLPRAGDLWMSWDAWHHPACAIGHLSSLGQLRIPFAKRMDNADIGNLIDDFVIPWLTRFGLLADPKRFTLHHCGDPTAFTPDQSNREHSAGKVLLAKLPGRWHDSVNDPDLLMRATRTALGASISTGEPRVLLCGPDAYEGHQALGGGWHLKKDGKPQKHGWEGRHSHVGDALAHLCHTVFGAASRGADMSKWVFQEAYVQPWGGAKPEERSPSPAAAVLSREQDRDAYRAKWKNQRAYRDE